MREYYVKGFHDPEDYSEWLEDMNSDYPDYVIDSVFVSGYVGYRVMVTFHFEIVPEEG